MYAIRSYYGHRRARGAARPRSPLRSPDEDGRVPVAARRGALARHRRERLRRVQPRRLRRTFGTHGRARGVITSYSIHYTKLYDDGIKLRQILFNLVGNAVKFTEKGHISVAVEAVKQEGHYDLTIAVEDTGYGIPKSEQRRIFKAFEQGEKMRKKITGTGLGLAITKRIVQMMKGEIRIKSQLFKGSTFIITLPGILAVEYGFTSPTHREARSSKYFPDLNVLIVDDIYRITSYNVCYTKLLRPGSDTTDWFAGFIRAITKYKTGILEENRVYRFIIANKTCILTGGDVSKLHDNN